VRVDRWLVLDRVADEPWKAQAVQVVHAAHALAGRGVRVTLLAASARVLDDHGLAALPTLTVRAIGRGTPASLRLRAALLTTPGTVLVREPRYADLARRLGRAYVYEAHDAVGDALEARVLAGARGVFANTAGTLAALGVPGHVLANASSVPRWGGSGVGIGVVGSVRPYKDPETVARAAPRVGGITWVGPGTDTLPAAVHARPPVPRREVPALLASFATLLLPLSPGRFGDTLTSPLKLWDALASGVPLVAADTPAVRAVAEGAYVPYVPGDADSLVAALLASPDVRAAALARARALAWTWDDRAARFLELARAMP
jgi:hypothetical protein